MLALPVFSQIAPTKAMFIFNFAKNMGWPESDAGNDFVITIIGDNEVASALEKLATTRKIANRAVVIQTAANNVSAEMSQIFYVGDNKTKEIPILAQKFPKGSVIVSSRQGQASNGAGYSFFITSEGKLNYEVCVKNINHAGLSVSNKVIELGTPVN